jgi:hypothetical protein
VCDAPPAATAWAACDVRFEEYDAGPIRTENKVATLGNHKAAWFKDTEGNFLCLHQTI